MMMMMMGYWSREVMLLREYDRRRIQVENDAALVAGTARTSAAA